MVATPWGPSESLRERRLRPGPGSTPEEVARNQRERVYGAMVESVAQRGYAATRLTDLTELSGVSSRSFYDLFPDKEACFLATIEAVLAAVAAEPPPEQAPAESWQGSALRASVGFARTVAEQPAAAKLCLLEGYAGGPEVLARLHDATAAFESRALTLVPSSPQGAAMTPELVSAYVGGLQEVAREQLRRGTEAELPALFETLSTLLIRSCPPPPAPLRSAARRSSPPPELPPAADPAERILQALAEVAAESGYATATIEQIVKRAGMSASTFYEHFQGRDDAVLAAIDSASAQIVAAVLPAFRRNADWPQAVRAGFGAFFNLLATRPALARLTMVEIYAAGPAALERRDEALRPLEALWSGARRRAPELPPIFFEAIMGGVTHLAFKRLVEEGPDSLPALAPVCAYIALAPVVGAEAAAAAANEEGEARRRHAPDPEAIRAAAAQPLRRRALRILRQGEATLSELAAELDQPPPVVLQHLEGLERAGLVDAAEPDGEGESEGGGGGGRGGEVRYRHTMGEVHTEEWRRLSVEERQLISSQAIQLIEADLDTSIESGRFDARPERVLVRAPLIVDEQGWQELSQLHAEMLAAALEIQARSGGRLAAGGEGSIEVRNLSALFEMPPADE
jgi:AcrR family transcriptional regulator